jgi:hypothetical protein
MRVIIDADLAALYGVPTKRLNQQVRRNLERFPDDFLLELTEQERLEVVANCNHLQRLKFSPSLPLAFTEHGALMAASVVNSASAVKVSIFVVRAFVELRDGIARQKDVASKLSELERRLSDHDEAIAEILAALRQLLRVPEVPARRIGFITE